MTANGENKSVGGRRPVDGLLEVPLEHLPGFTNSDFVILWLRIRHEPQVVIVHSFLQGVILENLEMVHL